MTSIYFEIRNNNDSFVIRSINDECFWTSRNSELKVFEPKVNCWIVSTDITTVIAQEQQFTANFKLGKLSSCCRVQIADCSAEFIAYKVSYYAQNQNDRNKLKLS